jgi:hypothetical protein
MREARPSGSRLLFSPDALSALTCSGGGAAKFRRGRDGRRRLQRNRGDVLSFQPELLAETRMLLR